MPLILWCFFQNLPREPVCLIEWWDTGCVQIQRHHPSECVFEVQLLQKTWTIPLRMTFYFVFVLLLWKRQGSVNIFYFIKVNAVLYLAEHPSIKAKTWSEILHSNMLWSVLFLIPAGQKLFVKTSVDLFLTLFHCKIITLIILGFAQPHCQDCTIITMRGGQPIYRVMERMLVCCQTVEAGCWRWSDLLKFSVCVSWSRSLMIRYIVSWNQTF